MITFEQARQIALENIGPECGLVEDSIIEKPYGWYFQYQSKKYLSSGNRSDLLVGSGGFIVEKEDGRIFEFGSAYPLADNFKAYERGFKYAAYDLTVKRVKELDQTVRLLRKLDMTYVIPEVAYGVEWKIPKFYTEKQIRRLLEKLPCTFVKQGFYFRFKVFDEIDESLCCQYEVREHRSDHGGNT